MKTFIFTTSFFRKKGISRDVEILENATLYSLAEAIVRAYGFDFDHAFGFFSDIKEHCFDSKRKYELFADMKEKDIEPTGAQSVKTTKISKVWLAPGDKMMFLFDYGDDWRFVVALKAFGEKVPSKKYPSVSNKISEAPRQYG